MSYKFREGQEKIVKDVIEATKNYKVILIDAPTGAGKSFINLVVANLKGSGYVTTPLKLLVDQYDYSITNEKNYENMGTVLKGRNAYPCTFLRYSGVEDATADGAPCEAPPKDWTCPNKPTCEYYIRRDIARESKVTVTTLAYMFTGIRNGMDIMVKVPNSDPPEFKPLWDKRKVLIIDEAHNIDDQLVDFFTIRISKLSLRKRITDNSMIEFNFEELNKEPTLDKLKELLRIELREITEMETLKLTPEASGKLSSLKTSILRILKNINMDVRYIYDKVDGVHIWKPYEVYPFTQSFFEKFDNVILSSATFVMPEILLHSIGLPNDYKIFKMPSTFPTNNALVKLVPVCKVSTKTDEDLISGLKKIMPALEKIAEAHKTERGFIHCKSYAIQDYIFEHANEKLKMRFYRHDKDTREENLNYWLKEGRKDSIFLSVHMGEGVDLKGDLARWQVIIKTPYLYLKDKYVSAHFNSNNGQKWYNQKAIIELIQMCGRVMRSQDDFGITYVLDTMAMSLLMGNSNMLPSWFRERVKIARDY